MASRCVEGDEEFIEETQLRTKTHKKVRTAGLKFSNNGQRREEKMSNLKFGQLRVNFTCILKVFQNALVASRLGQFCENFENRREINP